MSFGKVVEERKLPYDCRLHGPNLEARRKLSQWTADDWESRHPGKPVPGNILANRQKVMEWCEQDLLFFVTAYCWLYEPRTTQVSPFCPTPPQVDFLRKLDECVPHRTEDGWSKGRDVLTRRKSRDQGASWTALAKAAHTMLFRPFSNVGLCSASEERVDNGEDPSSLFWKLRFLFSGLSSRYGLPHWMRPKLDFAKRKITNKDLSSVATGYAASPDTFRSGRYLFVVMDELDMFTHGKDYAVLAASQFTADCRVIISTLSTRRMGTGAFFEMITSDQHNAASVDLHWRHNPLCTDGLYRVISTQNGKKALSLVDREYWSKRLGVDDSEKLESQAEQVYEFILDDAEFRSIWYDDHCRRPGMTKDARLCELDCNPYQRSASLFDLGVLNKQKFKFCRQPTHRCAIEYDEHVLKPKLRHSKTGDLLLWCELDLQNRPAIGNYVVAADIAMGGGSVESSNSTLEVVNLATGEQVAEFVSRTTPPDELAMLAAALGKLFCAKHAPATIIWETQGPGAAFTRMLTEDLRYARPYMRMRNAKFKKKFADQSPQVGWVSTNNSRNRALEELSTALSSEQIVVRSEPLLQECGCYIVRNGKYLHVKSWDTVDEKSKGFNHGDRVMAIAMANVVRLSHREKFIPVAKVNNDRLALIARPLGDRWVRVDEGEEAVEWEF